MQTTTTTMLPPMVLDHRSYVHGWQIGAVVGLLLLGMIVGAVITLAAVSTIHLNRQRH